MARTLMDDRYYYGIRQEAAYVLSKVRQPLGLLIKVRYGVLRLDWRVSSHLCISTTFLFSKFNNANGQ